MAAPGGEVPDEISNVHLAEMEAEVQTLLDLQKEFERLEVRNSKAETKLKADGKLDASVRSVVPKPRSESANYASPAATMASGLMAMRWKRKAKTKKQPGKPGTVPLRLKTPPHIPIEEHFIYVRPHFCLPRRRPADSEGLRACCSSIGILLLSRAVRFGCWQGAESRAWPPGAAEREVRRSASLIESDLAVLSTHRSASAEMVQPLSFPKHLDLCPPSCTHCTRGLTAGCWRCSGPAGQVRCLSSQRWRPSPARTIGGGGVKAR